MSDWIVVRNPPPVLERKSPDDVHQKSVCLRCGTEKINPLPMSIGDYCEWIERFRKQHEKCKKVGELMQFLIWRSSNGTIGIADDGEEFICGKTVKFGSIVTVAAVIDAVDRTQAIARFEQQNPRPQIKVITLHQPWASLIAMGYKRFETRSYAIKYRGPLAIHAAQLKPRYLEREIYGSIHNRYYKGQLPAIDALPLGRIVAICDIVDCQKLTSHLICAQPGHEKAVGDWGIDRYAWKLENIKPLPEPIDHIGQQGLHRLSAEEIAEVDRQLRSA
jgi:activating signal cointegrator 1